MTVPTVSLKDWIRIGKKDAIVCRIYDTPDPQEIEVVYLDGPKAINGNAVWRDDGWAFTIAGPNGGYANNIPRLREYVAKLRAGRQ